jgi:hypothetical protein
MRSFGKLLFVGSVYLAAELFAPGAVGRAQDSPPSSAAALPATPVAAPPKRVSAAELVSDFLGARPGADLGLVTPINGSGRFRLAEPAAARQIVDAAGRPLGYLFGAAKLEYEIEPADETVVRYNLERTDDVKLPEKGKPFRFDAVEVAWLSLEGPEPEPNKAFVEPAPDVLKRAVDPRMGGGSPAVDFAAARLAGKMPIVWVVAKLKDDRFLAYAFDPGIGRESLFSAKKGEWQLKGREDWLRASLIDDRPVGRSRQTTDPFPTEVRSIDIRIVEGTDQMGEVEATVDYGFLRHSAGLLQLGWVDEAFDARTPGNVKFFKAEMKSISDMNGRAVPHAIHRDQIVVELGRRMKPGDVVRLKFRYSLPLIQYGGDQFWRLGEQPWYPMAGGDLRRNAARMRAEIHSRKPFTAWGTGKIVRRWEEGDHNCVILEEPRSSDFPVVGAGLFFPWQMTDAKGRVISVVSYAMERPTGQERLGKLFAGLVEYYESFYPKYPFDYLTIVEANDWGFGQAPAGYINITKEAFNPLAEEISQMYSKFANDIFAHEIGHSWWGHYFRAHSTEDQWLEESFAEYSCALVLEWTRKKGDMERKSKEWKKDAADVKEPIPIVAANRITGEDAFLYRTRLLYSKGPWVLHCLRSEIGDKAFFVTLKAFLQTYEGKIVRTEDFIDILDQVTKKDWHPWFEKYIYGAETPSLAKK